MMPPAKPKAKPRPGRPLAEGRPLAYRGTVNLPIEELHFVRSIRMAGRWTFGGAVRIIIQEAIRAHKRKKRS